MKTGQQNKTTRANFENNNKKKNESEAGKNLQKRPAVVHLTSSERLLNPVRQKRSEFVLSNGQFALRFSSGAAPGEPSQDAGLPRSHSVLITRPFQSKHTFSAFLWGGEKSFIILMGVKYVFQIY